MEINQAIGDQSVTLATHCDITMGNDVTRDTHCDITMGNDVTKEIHCDITMSNDISVCTYLGNKMHNDVAMNLVSYVLLCLFMLFYYGCVVWIKNKNRFVFDQSGLENT